MFSPETVAEEEEEGENEIGDEEEEKSALISMTRLGIATGVDAKRVFVFLDSDL